METQGVSRMDRLELNRARWGEHRVNTLDIQRVYRVCSCTYPTLIVVPWGLDKFAIDSAYILTSSTTSKLSTQLRKLILLFPRIFAPPCERGELCRRTLVLASRTYASLFNSSPIFRAYCGIFGVIDCIVQLRWFQLRSAMASWKSSAAFSNVPWQQTPTAFNRLLLWYSIPHL